MTEAIELGKYGVPVILSIVLSLIYNTVPSIPNKAKPWIAIIAGIGLGITALLYQGLELTFVNCVDFTLAGLMYGASATGLYELQKETRRTT